MGHDAGTQNQPIFPGVGGTRSMGNYFGRWAEKRNYDKICKSRYKSLDALLLHLPTLFRPKLQCSEGITLSLSKQERAFPLQCFHTDQNKNEGQRLTA